MSVAPVADPPSGQADVFAVDEDSSSLLDVLANDSDADGDSLSLQSVGAAMHGQTSIEAGRVRYQPDPDYHGSDSSTTP